MTPDQERALALANARLRLKDREERDAARKAADAGVLTPDGIGGGDVLNTARAALQGLTFGLSDEAGAAAAATAAMLINGADFKEAYGSMLDNIRLEQNRFSDENPKTALAANIAGGLPVAIPAMATLPGAAAAGSVAGFGFSDEEGVNLAVDTGIGALTGLGGTVLFRGLGAAGQKVFRKLAGRGVALADDAGKVTDEAIDALEQEFSSGRISADDLDSVSDVLTPEQLRRVQLFQKRGVTPLKANATQSTDDFRNLQEASKRSGKLSETMARQDLEIAETVSKGVDDLLPSAQSLPEANARVYSVVDDVIGAADDKVNQAYTAAREAAPDAKLVRYTNLTEKLRQSVGNETSSGGVPSALRQSLKNNGVLVRGFKEQGRTDVATAERIRQDLNGLFDPANPRGNALIRELKDALDDDVASAVGEDIFAEARQAKVSLQRIIERGRRNKFDSSKGSFLENVINNRIPEEKIIPKLLSGRDDDFAKFKTFLTEDSGEAGVQAWQDIKAQVLRDGLESALGTAGKGEGGVRVFNANKFAQKFKNLRTSNKFNELFDPSERDLIDDIIEIGYLRLPPRLVATGKGPSGFAVDELRREIVRQVPLVGDKVADLLDRSLAGIEAGKQLNPTKATEQILKGARPPK